MALAAASEPITINFWHTGGSGALQEAVQFATNRFNETVGAEKGIKVVETFIGNYDELTAKIQLSIQANEQPQVATRALPVDVERVEIDVGEQR